MIGFAQEHITRMASLCSFMKKGIIQEAMMNTLTSYSKLTQLKSQATAFLVLLYSMNLNSKFRT